MNTLSYAILLLLTALAIFYPAKTFGTEELSYSNGIGKDLENRDEATPLVSQSLISGSKFDDRKSVGNSDVDSKSKFLRVDNESATVNFDFLTSGNQSLLSCNSIFKCTPSFSTGWKDDKSLMISTSNTNYTWSKIYGQEIDAKPTKPWQLVTHMKLNNWTKQSHVTLEGFNESSKQWYQVKQCPTGINGPLEWQEFSCFITIPENTTKIRPVLNAGWSSQPKKEATTWYDSVYLINLDLRKFYVTDPSLKVELVASGLKEPTSMAFLGEDEILVLEKDNGTVRKIIDGKVLAKPLLDVPVATRDERGLLGIAISRSEIDKRTFVFLYYTESATGKDGDDITLKKEPLGNRLYRYEYIDGNLVNPKLLVDLPASPGPDHNGGALTIGPDKQSVYLAVGDVKHKTKSINNKTGVEPDGTGGILRITLDGKPVNGSNLGDNYPLNLYYGYGIRNSFGVDFDPVTGNLWDTENGPSFGDEINLVEPGFNSGWKEVQGMWTVASEEKKGNLNSEDPRNLVDFNGRGKYSSPELTWNNTVAPTAIKFLTSDKLGEQYKNDMFVADENTNRIYHFKLSQNRTALLLQDSLIDKIADNRSELDNVVFAGIRVGTVSDLEVGPDGYLYLLSHTSDKIFRIVPRSLNDDDRPLN